MAERNDRIQTALLAYIALLMSALVSGFAVAGVFIAQDLLPRLMEAIGSFEQLINYLMTRPVTLPGPE